MDLHRRDFTINTLALRLDGEHYGQLFDFWGGYDDLMQKKIRVLHALSFVDDATRMMRAVRFAERFDFEIEERTLSLLQASLPLIDELTGARIRHELDLIFQEDKISQIMQSLQSFGILKAIHPDLNWTAAQKARIETAIAHVEDGWLSLENLQTALWMLWLEAYPEQTIQDLGSRLRLTADMVQKIRQTARLRDALPGLDKLVPSHISEKLSKFPEMVIQTVLYSQNSQVQPLEDYLNTYQKIRPYTSGEDLKARGLPPS